MRVLNRELPVNQTIRIGTHWNNIVTSVLWGQFDKMMYYVLTLYGCGIHFARLLQWVW